MLPYIITDVSVAEVKDWIDAGNSFSVRWLNPARILECIAEKQAIDCMCLRKLTQRGSDGRRAAEPRICRDMFIFRKCISEVKAPEFFKLFRKPDHGLELFFGAHTEYLKWQCTLLPDEVKQDDRFFPAGKTDRRPLCAGKRVTDELSGDFRFFIQR